MRARGRELSARLQVGDRGRHQLREVGEPALHAGRERALARAGRDHTPELALDDDRARKRGADPLRLDDLGHARGRRVVRVESSGPPAPVNLGDDEVRIQLGARAHRVPGGVGSHDGHRAVGLEAEHGGGVRSGERLDLVAHRTEESVRRHAPRDQRGHAPQRCLLLGEHRSRLARLGVGDRRRYELGEVREPRLGVFRERLVPRRENHHRAPQTTLDRNRARDGRAHARATNDSSDLPDLRPARSDRERLVIALAEAADHDGAVRLVADQPDVRDIEDPGDLLCDDGKELIRRRFARDEGRDLPEGGLFGGELTSAFFRALEPDPEGGLGVASGASAQEVSLAPTERRCDGDRPVAQKDLAAALGDVESARLRQLGTVEHVAVPVHEQICAPRHEIAVATSQPSVPVAPGIHEALLDRPGSGGHQLQALLMRGRPEAREVNQSDRLAGHRVVHRSAGADPLMMEFVEVLEGEHLEGMVCGQRSPDPVRAVGCLAVPRALDEIHLGGTLLQPLVAHPVQDEPRRIGHDDHAPRLLGHLRELLRENVGECRERMLVPALEHLRFVGLDRGKRVGRIEAYSKRAPPRIDDCGSQPCFGLRWKLGFEPAVDEQTLPTSLELSSTDQRIRVRSDTQPLKRHVPTMIVR
jgi:hypothetical protein